MGEKMCNVTLVRNEFQYRRSLKEDILEISISGYRNRMGVEISKDFELYRC